jgi:DNA polymerase-3 subunit epsilon
MRQVVLDTETTGLEPEAGHRIIEIGGVELLDRRQTGRVFHTYLNPDRSIDEGAQAVHGISIDDLRDKPRFAQVVDELLGFIVGAELVIHNAAFDLAFLDAELALLRPPRGRSRELVTGVVDSLLLARQKHPGQKNSLDALCRRYDIDDSHRTLHGALLDAQLLAEVYLAMTGGQTSLQLAGPVEREDERASGLGIRRLPAGRPRLRVVEPSDEERDAHARVVAQLERSGRTLWQALDRQVADAQAQVSHALDAASATGAERPAAG